MYANDYEYYKHTIPKTSMKNLLSVLRPIITTAVCSVLKNRFHPDTLVTNFINKFEEVIEATRLNVERMRESGKYSIKELFPRDFVTVFKVVAPTFISALLSQMTIRKITSKYSIPDQEVEMMWGNRRENVADQMNHAMMRMAIALKEILANHPEVEEKVKVIAETRDQEATMKLIEEFRNQTGDDKTVKFITEWDAFMTKFGCRGPAEIDIAVPRYMHRPAMVMAMMYNLDVTGYENEDEGDRKREAAVQAVLSKVTKKSDRKKIEKHLPTAQLFLAYRETPKFSIIRIYAIIRSALLEIGKDLTAKGFLVEENDIFYLTVEELKLFEEEKISGGDLKSIVANHKHEMELSEQMQFPKIVVGPECIMKSVSDATLQELKDLPPNMLKGLPTSAGVIEGRAIVATDPDTAVVMKGDILIAKATDPGWTPLFMPAAGVAIEIGGPLTHGSVVARERGIPCVVGIMGLMDKIKTGMRVRVDGNKGLVEILEE